MDERVSSLVNIPTVLGYIQISTEEQLGVDLHAGELFQKAFITVCVCRGFLFRISAAAGDPG